MRFDRHRARLELDVDELRTLVRMASGDLDPVEADPVWRDAGLVADGLLHPVAAGMAKVAIAPHRAVAIERLAGERVAPVHVGWESTGRATLTEPDGDGRITITATHLELLPAMVLQLVRLRPGAPTPERAPIRVDAADLDADLASVPEMFDTFEHAWRATGSWQSMGADGSLTVVDAGRQGLWIAESDAPPPAVGGEASFVLAPVAPREVIDRLGDIVTGRRVPIEGAESVTLV